MLSAHQTLDRQYLEMRSRVLALAADLDRIQRARAGAEVLKADPRVTLLKECIRVVLSDDVGRAERVQMLLSDKSPPPSR